MIPLEPKRIGTSDLPIGALMASGLHCPLVSELPANQSLEPTAGRRNERLKEKL
jgi:hypothetical protein